MSGSVNARSCIDTMGILSKIWTIPLDIRKRHPQEPPGQWKSPLNWNSINQDTRHRLCWLRASKLSWGGSWLHRMRCKIDRRVDQIEDRWKIPTLAATGWRRPDGTSGPGLHYREPTVIVGPPQSRVGWSRAVSDHHSRSVEWTRLQLHTNEMTMSIVSLRQEKSAITLH